jgi:hypothetical protein
VDPDPPHALSRYHGEPHMTLADAYRAAPTRQTDKLQGLSAREIVRLIAAREISSADRPPNRDLVDRVARESERGSAGLPIAVQVIARPWRDHVALAAMAQIEVAARKLPDYPARPPL